MDSSPFSARRGKATVTSSHDFISDTQAKLREQYQARLWCCPYRTTLAEGVIEPRWLMRAKTIPVSRTRKRGVPGLGYIEKAGSGYRLIPAAWNPVI